MKYVFVRFCVARILCIYLSLYSLSRCNFQGKRCECLISFFLFVCNSSEKKMGYNVSREKEIKPKRAQPTVRQRTPFQLPVPNTFLFQSFPFYFASHTFNNLPPHIRLINPLLGVKRKAQQHIRSYSCPCSRHLN